jgi:hemerythrin
MLSDQFTQTFRDEHRKIRDTLLELIQAFKERDKSHILSLLNQAATYTGPHFRYEEEALYPALIEIFGKEYIEKLLSDHDLAIGTALKLIQLSGEKPLTNYDITKAIQLVRNVLPHVSDCDGLSIMTEILSQEKIKWISETRDRSIKEGLNLIDGAYEVRTRRAFVPK